MIKEHEKISVIIPVYNSEKYISKCLKSIVNQSYKNLEIIVVNDGSTDKSLKIINKFASKDSRIKVINQKNSGGNNALNKGLSYASGDYIHFVDSDDYLIKGAYKLLVKKINVDKNIDTCLFLFKRVDTKGRKLPFQPSIAIKQDTITDIKKDPKLLITFYSAQWSKFYRTSLIKSNNISFDKTYFGYDMLFHLKVLKYSKKVLLINNALNNYRCGNDNSSSGFLTRSKYYAIHFECFNNCVKEFEKEPKYIKDANICHQFAICLLYLNISSPEFKLTNYFMFRDFLKSLPVDILKSLKTDNKVYQNYLDILNYNYLRKYIVQINQEKFILLNSKSYKLGRFLSLPYRFIKKVLK